MVLKKEKYGARSFITIFISLVLIASLVPSVQGDTRPDFPKLNVVLQSYDPFPAEPGEYVTLKFRATNVGTETAPSTVFELRPDSPFSVEYDHDDRKEFGSLLPGQSVNFEFRARVRDDAVVGDNQIKLRHSTDSTRDNWITNEYDVSIRIIDSLLSISDVNAEPELFNPGHTSRLSLNLSNSGSTSIRDVSVRLNLDKMDENPDFADNMPFAPTRSTTERSFRLIGPDSVETMDFDLMTFSDADAGVYRIPMTISYRDESGEVHTKDDIVGVRVGSEPRISASVDSVDLSSSGADANFRIVNRGTIDLKFVTARVMESDDFELNSASDEFYIGRLSSDDFDTISFDLDVDRDKDYLSVPLELEFLDANNNEFIEEYDLTINMDAVRRSAAQEGGSGALVILIVAAVFVGLFLYKRKRKKAKR